MLKILIIQVYHFIVQLDARQVEMQPTILFVLTFQQICNLKIITVQ